jgi:HD-GYP domain-containing protein (c-di-GMP phosphodiesterase class II)/HAMP domain-containing protein
MFNLYFQEEQMNTQRDLILKNAVMHAYTLAEIKYGAVINRGLDEQLAKEHIKEALLGKKLEDGTRTMDSNYSLGENGYFIIYSSEGEEIAHPRLEGQNVFNVTDPLNDSVYIVREQIEMAKNNGEGYYYYNWEYPNDPGDIGKKISFVKYFEPWDWIIVATTYERDLKAYFEENRNAFIYTAIFIVLLMIPLVYYISKKITKPLSNLNSKMQYFSNNMEILNIDDSTRIKGVSELEKSFLDMSEELTAYIEELQGLNEEIESLNSENSMIIEKMNILLDETSDVLDFDNEEEFLIQAFNNLYNLIPESSSGIISMIKGDEVKYIASKNFEIETLNSLSLKKNQYITYENVFKTKNIKTIKHDLLSEDKKIALNNIIKSVNESLYIPLNGYKKQIGNLIFHTNGNTVFTEESFRIAVYYSKLISLFLKIENMNEFQSNVQKQIIVALIKMMEHHDTYTKGHSQNVAELAEDFSKFLGYDKNFLNRIYWSGMVHDIGKIIIPQDVLNKPAKLTHDEYDLIKKHPVYAFEVLHEIDNLKDISHIVKHHHERVDGRGYPDNLSDTDIPVESKILCLVDTWDAMTRNRSYRKALSKEVAKKELLKNKGKQFDEKLVDYFIKFIEKE